MFNWIRKVVFAAVEFANGRKGKQLKLKRLKWHRTEWQVDMFLMLPNVPYRSKLLESNKFTIRSSHYWNFSAKPSTGNFWKVRKTPPHFWTIHILCGPVGKSKRFRSHSWNPGLGYIIFKFHTGNYTKIYLYSKSFAFLVHISLW